jgi:dihydrofolate reductase
MVSRGKLISCLRIAYIWVLEVLMRKVLFSMLVSLDGYFEGPNHAIDWHNLDDEFNVHAEELLHTVDLLLFGRVTYQLMAAYWPTPEALGDDPIIAALMNNTPKLVFSKTLDKVGWQNTRLVKGDPAQEIARLKQQPGKDMVIFGSSDLAAVLSEHGLIDEYQIMVNPLFLGEGKPLLKGIKGRLKLKLLRTQTFTNGNVMLCYGPLK